jgi:hypothetical protein
MIFYNQSPQPVMRLPRVAVQPGYRAVFYQHVLMPQRFRVRQIKDGYEEPAAPEGWLKVNAY